MATDARSRRPILLFVAATAASFAVFAPMALSRLVARDEGFYLLASELVTRGRLPYVDFFYPQTPFLPYLYGTWIGAFGDPWTAARMLSALLAAATGGLLFTHLARRFGLRYGVLGLLLYLACDLTLCWYSVVKSYAAVSLLVLAAVLAAQSTWSVRWTAPLVSGFCLGLAVNARLVLAAVIPVLGWTVARRAERGALGFFTAGLLLALGPGLVLMAADPQAFWFDNLGYHLIRSDDPSGAGLAGKIEILLALAGIGSADGGYGFQLPLLLYAGIVSAVAAGIARRGVEPALPVAAVIFIAHFAPSPAYVQYFSILVPLLILPAVDLCRRALARVEGTPARARLVAALALPAVAYVALLPTTLRDAIAPDKASRLDPNARTFAHVEAVRLAIDEVAAPGDAVYASWPGFLVGSHATALGGTENQFGVDVAAKLSPERRRRVRVMSRDEIAARIASGSIRVAVLPDRIAAGMPALEQVYEVVARVGGTTVYARRDDDP